MAKKSVKDVVDAAGGAAALARTLKISRAAISQWKRIPIGRVAKIETLTGIPRYEMRPDIYEQPHQ